MEGQRGRSRNGRKQKERSVDGLGQRQRSRVESGTERMRERSGDGLEKKGRKMY